MPVSLVTTDESAPNYLIPAPFVSISKAFDKQGDGEIIGTRYTITLTGHIVADRGSPNKDGGFITDGVDVVTLLTDSDDWYASLQQKQKAISNLISKLNAGGYLEVDPPNGGEGFKCHVKLEAVDLPTHNPGDPFKSEYTITFNTDHILGPGGVADNDDWENVDKWLVSSASETWEIVENETVYHRHKIPTDGTTDSIRIGPSSFDAGGCSDTGYDNQTDCEAAEAIWTQPNVGALFEQNKTYKLTRTSSATGKNKFARNSKADGLAADGYTQKYAANGKAWQQARGFIYDQYTRDLTPGTLAVGYGHRFLFGANDDEYEGGVPTGAVSEDDFTGDEADADDVHLFAKNLPVPNNTSIERNQYKAYNYSRTQNADTRGGTFTVIETWTLAPKFSKATESIDFSIQEDSNTGIATITVNGSIQGLLDNADSLSVGNEDNPDRSVTRQENVKENFHYDGVGGTTNSKYHNALAHYNDIMPFMSITVKKVLNDIPDYEGITVNPVAESKTVAQQVGNGIITYSLSYSTAGGGGNYIPYVRSENISVNDTYPGHVAAQHVVMGRKLGPVMQNIGTQTLWQRDLTISGNFDVSRKNLCITKTNQLTTIGNEAACGKATYSWIENPNYINLLESIPHGGADFSPDMITAKPGDANTGSDITGKCSIPEHITEDACTEAEPAGTWTESSDRTDKASARRIQANAIKQLIDSFDPRTYFLTNPLSGATPRVRKRFMNAPQESWDMKTGAWSYAISWIYEINDPWAFPTEDFIDPNPANTQDDGMDHPYPGQIS